MRHSGGEEAELRHPVGEDELVAERIALGDVAREGDPGGAPLEDHALRSTDLERSKGAVGRADAVGAGRGRVHRAGDARRGGVLLDGVDEVDDALPTEVFEGAVAHRLQERLVRPDDDALAVDHERVGDPFHELLHLVPGAQERSEDLLHGLVLASHLVEERVLAVLAEERAGSAAHAAAESAARREGDVVDGTVRSDGGREDERRLVAEDRGDGANAPDAHTEVRLASRIGGGGRESVRCNVASPRVSSV